MQTYSAHVPLLITRRSIVRRDVKYGPKNLPLFASYVRDSYPARGRADDAATIMVEVPDMNRERVRRTDEDRGKMCM